jgi:hypothetical protein
VPGAKLEPRRDGAPGTTPPGTAPLGTAPPSCAPDEARAALDTALTPDTALMPAFGV